MTDKTGDVEVGRVVLPAVEGEDLAHKLGHLLGGQHQHATCTAAAESRPEPQRVEPRSCSLMFGDRSVWAPSFGPLDGAIVRGYAEEFAKPIAEPMPVIEPEPEPGPDPEEPPPGGPLDPELEAIEPWVGEGKETAETWQRLIDEQRPCVEAEALAPPSVVTSPRIELRVLFLLDGTTRAEAEDALATLKSRRTEMRTPQVSPTASVASPTRAGRSPSGSSSVSRPPRSRASWAATPRAAASRPTRSGTSSACGTRRATAPREPIPPIPSGRTRAR
jgi:hypothetical protein